MLENRAFLQKWTYLNELLLLDTLNVSQVSKTCSDRLCSLQMTLKTPKKIAPAAQFLLGYASPGPLRGPNVPQKSRLRRGSTAYGRGLRT